MSYSTNRHTIDGPPEPERDWDVIVLAVLIVGAIAGLIIYGLRYGP